MITKLRSANFNKNILKYFIEYITINDDKNIGARIIIYKILCISIRLFNNSHLKLRNLEVAFYLLPNLFLSQLVPKKELIYFCNNCGPFIEGYTEVWAKGADGPFKIEFFKYSNGSKEILDKIILGEKPGYISQLRYDYCGNCNHLIVNRYLPDIEPKSCNRTNETMQD